MYDIMIDHVHTFIVSTYVLRCNPEDDDEGMISYDTPFIETILVNYCKKVFVFLQG